MIQGHDIIYLAGHDFDVEESRTSTDYIAKELSRANRALFVESVGLRPPRLDTSDVRRMFRKLGRCLRAPRKIRDSLWVFTPLVLPWHHRRDARWINQRLLTAHIRLACRSLGFKKPIVFAFLPSMEGVIGRLRERLSVYYCTDEHAAFPGVHADTIQRAERELLRKVTLCFVTSSTLRESKSLMHRHCHYSPHAVDFAHFARAQDDTLPVPDELRGMPHPIVGYFGMISPWFDVELVEAVARARPSWRFVLIGRVTVDLLRLASLPNVLLLGQRPFEQLPAYGRVFDATIIPFRIDDLTIHVSPVKLKEYLAMGKPVVSTALPAVLEFQARHGLVDVAGDAGSFVEALEGALRRDSADASVVRQNVVRADTWEARVDELSEVIRTMLVD